MAKRQEFRVAGLNEPISHYTDVVRFGVGAPGEVATAHGYPSC